MGPGPVIISKFPKIRWAALIFVFLPLISGSSRAELVEYDMDIDYKTVNYTGRTVQAMAVGGTIPARTIEATEGDTLRVTFHNKMKEDTSIHWHGVLLPNDQDGVPYFTTPPIKAGASFTYEYPVIQSGTYWYHSHTALQEQRGLYGALVFHPKEKRHSYDWEHVVLFSDWTDEDPGRVLRNLKSDGDYYSFKKGTSQSWDRVLAHGWKAVKARLNAEWTRMGPMDLSDVGYDRFLTNGEPTTDFEASKGEKVLLRLVNGSASTYFDVQFAGGSMQVVAADGMDVEPVETGVLRIAVAETYDVIVTLPEDRAYELRATAMDGSGYTSFFIGKGTRISAPDRPKPDLFMTDHSAHGQHAGHGASMPAGHDHHAMVHGSLPPDAPLDYARLRSLAPTLLPAGSPVREVVLRLTGNMERYVWSFNDRKLEKADTIVIRKGENVRFVLQNETMMNHPIHLHGHFFRVLNGQGDYSPLKHTVDVKPFETTVIEFYANQEKDWLFHCHILYHMMSGMSRIVGYEGSPGHGRHLVHSDHAHWYGWGRVAAQSNMTDGFLKVTDDVNQAELVWDTDYDGEYDIEAKYLRNVSRFLDIFAGGEFEERSEHRERAVAGIRYVLPFLVTTECRIDQRGSLKFGFEKEVQLTPRLDLHAFYEVELEPEEEWDWSETNVEHDWRLELEYRLTDSFYLTANYDSDHRAGGGVRVKF